jgi:xanthine dehydrogenase accessory factor
MKKIVKSAVQLLEQGESFALATIVSQIGSAPRGQGAHMIVKKDGRIIGTVGGGLLEADVRKKAEEVLHNKESTVIGFDLTGRDVAEMGMVCGGRGEVFIGFIDGKDKDYFNIYSEMEKLLKERKRAWLVTWLPTEKTEKNRTTYGKQCLIKQDGGLVGVIEDDPALIRQLVERTNNFEIFTILDNRRVFIELIGNNGTAFVFGAGHVGEKLVPLLSLVGFKTVVLDDRKEFANKERFPSADKIIVLDSFEKGVTDQEIDQDSYIIIVTRGHLHDRIVLAQALKTDAGYIGMIGSRRKQDEVYRVLLNDGFTNKDLERVHSPIGLNIGGETPEEIAISITAELIQERTKQKK